MKYYICMMVPNGVAPFPLTILLFAFMSTLKLTREAKLVRFVSNREEKLIDKTGQSHGDFMMLPHCETRLPVASLEFTLCYIILTLTHIILKLNAWL